MKDTFTFGGVTRKKEVILGFACAISCLVFTALIQYFILEKLLGVRHIASGHFIMSIFMGLSIALVLLKFLGKKFRGTWEIVIIEKNIIEMFYNKQKVAVIEKKQIDKVIYKGQLGENGFRYLIIKYDNNKKISVRVGRNDLTPFSSENDMITFESFFNEFKKIFLPSLPEKKEVKKIYPSFHYIHRRFKK